MSFIKSSVSFRLKRNWKFRKIRVLDANLIKSEGIYPTDDDLILKAIKFDSSQFSKLIKEKRARRQPTF